MTKILHNIFMFLSYHKTLSEFLANNAVVTTIICIVKVIYVDCLA